MKKAAVVGGGVSGLIVGARLAQAGFEVAVFEKSPRIGGRAIGHVRDGFSLDHGLHMIRNGVKGFLPITMEKLEIPIELCVMEHPEFCWLDGDRLKAFPKDREEIMASDALTPEDKMALMSMMRPGIYEEFRDKPVREWLESVNGSGALGKFMRLLSLSVVCPFLDRASTGEVFESIRRRAVAGSNPAAIPRGGFFTALDILADYIRARAGSVITETTVRSINIRGGRAAGVETDSGLFPSDIVVCAFPYSNLFDILDPKLVETGVRDKLAALTPTAGICIYYALDSPVTGHKSVVIELGELVIYGIAISNLDPSLAPPGKQLIAFDMLTLPEDMENPARVEELTGRIEDFAFALWPEIPKKLLWKNKLYLKIVNSVQVNCRQHRDARPGPKELAVSGLHLAGDGLNALGGGGDLAITSANLCADTILTDAADA